MVTKGFTTKEYLNYSFSGIADPKKQLVFACDVEVIEIYVYVAPY